MSSSAKEKLFTKAEIQAHNKPDDLWICYRGKIYDMSSYYNQHPGGNAMLRQAGKDATIAMQMVKSHGMAWDFIQRKLAACCIGKLE